DGHCKSNHGSIELAGRSLGDEQLEAEDDLLQLAAADLAKHAEVSRLEGHVDPRDAGVEDPRHGVWREVAAVGDDRDADPATARERGHVEEPRVHERLAFALELDVDEIG